MLTIFPLSLLLAIISPVFNFKSSKNFLFKVWKLSGVKTCSNPSTLYDTIPLSGAFIYSEPEFSELSYILLSSINFLIYEPDGLKSPAIFAFLVIFALMSFLYSATFCTSFNFSTSNNFSCTWFSNSFISLENKSFSFAIASCIFISNSCIFLTKFSSLLL